MLGSVVYGGMTLGSAAAAGAFAYSGMIKPSLSLTLLLNALCYFGFTQAKSFYEEAGLRFMIGFFQVFVCIYMPVWADNYA